VKSTGTVKSTKTTTKEATMDDVTKCPFPGGARPHGNRDWWPNQLDLGVLHQHSTSSDPMGEAFDYEKNSRASISMP